MIRFLFVLFLTTVGLSSTAQPGGNNFSISFNKERTELPMQYRSRANPVIEVMVNGKGPYKFMFDTGSPGIAKLDKRLFEELKLPVIDSIIAGDGSGVGRQSFPLTKIDRLDFGGYIVLNTDAMVRNYNQRAGLDSIDGIIGMAFFDKVVVELNFETNKLIINKGKLNADAAGVFPSPYISGVPSVKLVMGDKEFTSIFDTGNMGGLTFLSSQIPKETMATEPKVIGRAQTVSNNFEIKEVVLSTPISIGTLVFEKPTVVMNDVLRQSNIGVRFVKQLNISFDKTNQLVKLVKYKQAASGSSSSL